MRRFSRAPSNSSIVALLAVAFPFALTVSNCAPARADDQNLQLEVIINGIPTNLIGGFVLFESGQIGAAPTEVADIGLRIDPQQSTQDVVLLDDIPTLTYRYDEQTQSIDIVVADAFRADQEFDLAADGLRPGHPATADWGLVLNYDLESTTGSVAGTAPPTPGNASITVYGRAFSPYGTIEQSATLQSAANGSAKLTRLDTTVRHSDQASMTTFQAGDLISGGLPWSRPIRIGGLQAQSNFSLRPDLITTPLLNLGSTAAVPSTVDVYVNNAKTHSQEVGPGPFTFANVPVTTGAGDARLVIRDSSGKEVEVTVPFYASARLLAPALSEWSLEAGLPRLAYGSTDDRYVPAPVASGTLRRGVFDWLTAEAHAELGAGIVNGGIGTVLTTGTFGVASVSLSASQSRFGTGEQASLSYETSVLGANVSTSFLRTFGHYEDLASATARIEHPADFSLIPVGSGPTRELDRLTIGVPLDLEWKPSASLSYIRTLDDAGNRSQILSLAYSQSLMFGGSMSASLFHDFAGGGNTGLALGINVPLDGDVTVNSSLSSGNGNTNLSTEAIKPLGSQQGSFGWRLRNTDGMSADRGLSASYRAKFGTVQVGVSQVDSSFTGSLGLRGSIATIGGGVFFSDWIDDGFAVVRTGVPDMEVLYENRSIGKTDENGMVLLPELRSYEANKISIDPTTLPVDAEIGATEQFVAPADRAGTIVEFDVASNTRAAIVGFVRGDGTEIPAGSVGRTESGEEFAVGYDGEAFIRDLADTNEVTIEFLDGVCSASFAFVPNPGEQVRIGPVSCQ